MKNSVSQFLFGASQFFKTNPHAEAYQGIFPKQHLQSLFYAKKELEKKQGETEQDSQQKFEQRIEKINQTLSTFASNPSEAAQPNYPDPVVKILNDYQQLASDRASGAVSQEQTVLRQGNLNQRFNSLVNVNENFAPLSGLISAVGQKVATKVVTKAAAGVVSKVVAAAAGIVNPILGAIVGFVSKELISRAITWLNRNKKRVFELLGGALAIGGLFVGGVGGALALGTGVVFIGAGAIGAQGISGAVSSVTGAIGQFTSTIGVSAISALVTTLIIAIAAVPVLVALVLFIINSGAYVVPGAPGITQACIPGGPQPPSATESGVASSSATINGLPICPTGCPAQMWPVTTNDGSKYYVPQGPGGPVSHGPPATIPFYDPITHELLGRRPVPYLEAIDIAPRGGNARNGLILITHPGVVKVAGVDNYGGNFVEVLDTCSGSGGTFRSLYVHMRPPLQVKTGDKVDVGTVVGKIGMTGYASGVHLHYEFLKPNGSVRADPSRKVPPFMTVPYIPKDVPQFCLQNSDAQVLCNVDIP